MKKIVFYTNFYNFIKETDDLSEQMAVESLNEGKKESDSEFFYDT
jgi:hypothetical protein